MCFNPHPPERAGATISRSAVVSYPKKFQSSPARKGGCYVSRVDAPAMVYSSFNPHPPERAGATRVKRPLRPCGQMVFQSSPARKGGCYSAPTAAHRGLGRWFQSSPARKGGCYRSHANAVQRSVGCFNPHPPERAGATLGLDWQHCRNPVSILTRPKGRVLRHSASRHSGAHPAFQSSPARKGGCYA